jgi:hypothetical protein
VPWRMNSDSGRPSRPGAAGLVPEADVLGTVGAAAVEECCTATDCSYAFDISLDADGQVVEVGKSALEVGSRM